MSINTLISASFWWLIIFFWVYWFLKILDLFQLIFIIFFFLFQDGLEFSSPKISAPFYSIDETCNPYAKDDKLFLETFQRHLNQPLSADSNNADAATADESRSSAANLTKFFATSDCQLVVMLLLIANSLLRNVII